MRTSCRAGLALIRGLLITLGRSLIEVSCVSIVMPIRNESAGSIVTYVVTGLRGRRSVGLLRWLGRMAVSVGVLRRRGLLMILLARISTIRRLLMVHGSAMSTLAPNNTRDQERRSDIRVTLLWGVLLRRVSRGTRVRGVVRHRKTRSEVKIERKRGDVRKHGR